MSETDQETNQLATTLQRYFRAKKRTNLIRMQIGQEVAEILNDPRFFSFIATQPTVADPHATVHLVSEKKTIKLPELI
jgi:hypothetical protein